MCLSIANSENLGVHDVDWKKALNQSIIILLIHVATTSFLFVCLSVVNSEMSGAYEYDCFCRGAVKQELG